MEKKQPKPIITAEEIRLIRFIASTGICSRRNAEKLIKEGVIRVNGEITTSPWQIIQPTDKVTYNGKLIIPEKKVYYLLNKPKNALCTTDDPEGRTTVFDFIRNPELKKGKLYTIGRLDYDSTGLIIITNDGDLTQKLAHPKNVITKRYVVTINGKLTQEQMLQTKKGIHLRDGMVNFDSIYYLHANKKNYHLYEVVLHSGKNRVIRRVFKELGFFVQELDRTGIGHLTKYKLAQSHWRPLSTFEVKKLYANKKTTVESKKITPKKDSKK